MIASWSPICDSWSARPALSVWCACASWSARYATIANWICPSAFTAGMSLRARLCAVSFSRPSEETPTSVSTSRPATTTPRTAPSRTPSRRLRNLAITYNSHCLDGGHLSAQVLGGAARRLNRVPARERRAAPPVGGRCCRPVDAADGARRVSAAPPGGRVAAGADRLAAAARVHAVGGEAGGRTQHAGRLAGSRANRAPLADATDRELDRAARRWRAEDL